MKEELTIYIYDKENSKKIPIRIVITSYPATITLNDPIAGKTVVFKGLDLYEAFLSMEDYFGKFNFLVLCSGCRLDVRFSGMSRSMSNGRRALQLTIGLPASEKYIVDIFDEADISSISTSDEREVYFKRWLKSIKN